MSLCYGCFKEKDDGQQVCPYCGYDPSLAKGKYPAALPLGTVLAGRYVIGKVLGQGGFGITYLAQDYKTKQPVAVKEYFPDTLALRMEAKTISSYSDERMESFEYGKKCFLEEADTLSKFLGNENICKILSYFEENGTAYFAMEYLDGESLLDYIKRNGGKIKYEDAKRILFPIMDALSAVHAQGIVHRDISPDNIIIEKNGKVKLLDFGAARYSLGDRSRSLDVVLKHGYAPKEQYTRHGRQGPFTDIYSLAATFYKSITGRTPPDSIDRLEEDNIVLPSSLGSDIPAQAEDALMVALSVNPSDRFRSMAAFKRAMESADNPASRTNTTASNAADYNNTGSYNTNTVYNNNTGFNNTTGYQNTTGFNNQTGYNHNTNYNTDQRNQTFVNTQTNQQTALNTAPAKKKWLVPVVISSIAAVAVIAIILVIVLAGRGMRPAVTDNSRTSSDVNSVPVNIVQETEIPKVKMSSYEGKTYEQAKAELEELGFTVSDDKDYSDSVTKGCVISQSIPEGELTEPCDITLTVSRGREHSDKGYDQQVYVQASAGSAYGTLHVYNFEEGEWVEKLRCDCAVGSNGITDDYGEGIKATPKGEFKLGFAISANDIDTKLEVYRASYDTCFVDDTSSSLYNTIQNVSSLPSGTHYDRIGDGLTSGENYAQIFIEHNGDGHTAAPSRYAGSAITICGMTTSLKGTWGCIDIAADDMKILLRQLDPSMNPHILTSN